MPKRKIYDIKPPKIKEVSIKERPVREKESSKKTTRIKKFFWVILVLILGIFFYWNFSSASKAQIEIWPKTETLNFDISLVVSTSTEAVNLSQFKIPGFLVEAEKTLSKQFKTTIVDVQEKARGTIRVYNKYKTAVTLVKGTRFLSSTEPTRQFHIQKKIVIPAGGYIDVEVIASEPGPDYNIGPSAFSIPGLRNFSPPQLYYDVFGKSFSKMEGGRIGKVAKLTEDDVSKAKETLKDLVQAETEKILAARASEENLLILGKTIKTRTVDQGVLDAKIGDERENFIYQLKIQVKALGIKKDQLQGFVKDYFLTKVPPKKAIYQESLSAPSVVESIGPEGKITLNLGIVGKIYSTIDQQAIKEIAKSQPPKNISKYLLEFYPEVIKPPKVRLSPFWAKRAPKNPEAISIKLNF
jgi:hypothetical protein